MVGWYDFPWSFVVSGRKPRLQNLLYMGQDLIIKKSLKGFDHTEFICVVILGSSARGMKGVRWGKGKS